MKKNPPTGMDVFGSMAFNEAAMREKLPPETFAKMQASLHRGKRLDPETASVVANAMMEWAIERGATHFTHWFQPMTGITAEKHEGFLTPSEEGKAIAEFSGKELVRGESDASSLPSGGLRATFEARGYTAWDPTSFAFVKDKTLYIPTAFCSYGGEALDKKNPLLRAMEALSKQAVRILRLFGNETVTTVKSMVGTEQEYFLVEESAFRKRPDLLFTGRTLIGAPAPKGQELDDHYYGSIQPRVKAFMEEVNEELWKVGVFARTEHNEAAPGQYELAPIYTTSNIACDHNQIIMEMLQRIARRHGLVCLLHEKPFRGVNGSGKHNNFSMTTDTGINLLEPGDTPHENAQFLLFLLAVIAAVDEYQDLLRISVATAANDHRLGRGEAPPSVVSIFIGEELSAVFDAIERKDGYSAKDREMMKIGVHVLPKFPKDSTDRNRTSPVAFTGNKFEFRSPGSSASPAGVNIVINTAVAQVLREFADRLEAAEDRPAALQDLIRETITRHRRILFNGNGYDKSWLEEAERRGLSCFRNAPEAYSHYLDEKNVRLFTENKVFSETELAARKEICEENYAKVLNIEANTMRDMVFKGVLPAVTAYRKTLSDTVAALGSRAEYESETLERLSDLEARAYELTRELETLLTSPAKPGKTEELACWSGDVLVPLMDRIREQVDAMETLLPESLWPYPGYWELLFSLI